MILRALFLEQKMSVQIKALFFSQSLCYVAFWKNIISEGNGMRSPSEAYNIGYVLMQNLMPGNDLWAKAYGIVAAFLHQYPEMQSARNKVTITPGYLEKHVRSFVRGRFSNGPVMPRTVPDERIKDVLQIVYNIPQNRLDEAVQRHMEAMGAENFIGWALEAYIALHAEPIGWVWCSGTMIKAVDFIHPFEDGRWQMLQIKNRSNSENSSSSMVRDGTTIEKWFRTHANTGRTNWNAFPDVRLCEILSEEDFRSFIVWWIQNNFLNRQ